ncbi:MAG: thymidylate kinase [Clostridia bacterium]|nr:thymidylate kinase [Clostridia bacterium]NDO18600.1 thymidylate kinase [Lachnospiraceae bacterium MD329]
MMGKLIAIDGVDASGKQTQTTLLLSRLEKEGREVKMVSFPAYDKPSSILVKMYLNGEFGENPSDVNAYATSTLFAADRFATYRTDWGTDYNRGTIILADRYVSSNLIHQASKINDTDEKEKFLMWLDDLEYGIYNLPRPDVTIFLDMPPEYGAELMSGRLNKSNGDDKKDIHESDFSYLEKSYENAMFVAKKFNWKRISCIKDGQIRSVDEIHEDIYSIVRELL